MNDQERIALMNKIIHSDGKAITEIELNKAERKVFDEISSFYRILIAEHIKDKENLKRSNRMLENKIHKQHKELNRLNKENKNLKEEIKALKEVRDKVDSLKEDRKHLLQDKNAVINLTKAFLDDTIDHTTYEVYGLLQNYYKKLTEINLGSNDSNTKTYLELKHSRDHYKRLVDILKRKSKEEIDTREDIILQISEQNQKLVNEVNRLKEEMEDLEERNILAFKALRLQTKGK